VGYQEDIPWPSLADSPWPTTNADMQRTGRSKYIGPQQGIIAATVPAHQMQTGVVFGSDSVFYYGISYRYGRDSTMLVAAKTEGSILWRRDLWDFETTTTPLIDKNGTIYIANGSQGKIFTINPDGSFKWEYDTKKEVFNRGLGLGKDGILYGIENGSTLLAIKQDGTLLGEIQDNNFGVGRRVNLTFSPDGNTLYIAGNKIGTEFTTLLAFDLPGKTIKWKFGRALIENGPMVDSNGNIYVLVEDDSVDQSSATFYCLHPDGNIKWRFPHSRGQSYWDIDPTIDKEGNIYFATDTLYALNYEGGLRWKFPLGAPNWSPLICDAQGTVYSATYEHNTKISAISKEGILKWQITGTEQPGQCPGITKDGKLVWPSWRAQNIYIIK
jgi:outer membrane protein assembly factor BamB